MTDILLRPVAPTRAVGNRPTRVQLCWRRRWRPPRPGHLVAWVWLEPCCGLTPEVPGDHWRHTLARMLCVQSSSCVVSLCRGYVAPAASQKLDPRWPLRHGRVKHTMQSALSSSGFARFTPHPVAVRASCAAWLVASRALVSAAPQAEYVAQWSTPARHRPPGGCTGRGLRLPGHVER